MRREKYILSVFAVMCVLSCGNAGKKAAVDVAEKFVEAYFAADYKKAASLCSEDFGAKVGESEAMVDSLPDDLKQEFYKLSNSIETHCGETYEFSSDSLMVYFDIVVPGEIETLHNAVCVVKVAGTQDWQVVEMR